MAKFYTYGIVYRTYDFIRNFVNYRRVRSSIKDVFYSDDFKMLVKRYLNVELDEDWLGRLYGVINPNVNIEGNFDVNNVIIEIDGEHTNTDEYVKTWIHRQLNVMGRLFNMKNFYSNVNFEIRPVGPIGYDNYLIIFDIADRPVMADSFRKWLRTFTAYAVAAGTVLGTLLAAHVI